MAVLGVVRGFWVMEVACVVVDNPEHPVSDGPATPRLHSPYNRSATRWFRHVKKADIYRSFLNGCELSARISLREVGRCQLIKKCGASNGSMVTELKVCPRKCHYAKFLIPP